MISVKNMVKPISKLFIAYYKGTWPLHSKPRTSFSIKHSIVRTFYRNKKLFGWWIYLTRLKYNQKYTHRDTCTHAYRHI